MKATPYEDLGIEPTASPRDVKRAYRRKAKKHHPDVGGKREDFDRVQKAWLILSDSKRRQQFDETGEADEPATEPALEILRQLFEVAVGKFVDEGVDDLREIMFRSIGQKIRVTTQQIEQIKKKHVRLGTLKGKIGIKEDAGHNWMGDRVESLLIEGQSVISQMEQEIMDWKAAEELLAFFIFPAPPAPEPHRAKTPAEWVEEAIRGGALSGFPFNTTHYTE